MLEFILILLMSYLIGSFPTAYLVVKWRYNKDIRVYGSGSVGASNVFRNFSKPFGILVFIWDFGKGALVVWVAQLLHMQLEYQIAVALVVVIGHNWPVFLKFNAGRGLATTLGAALVLMPWLIIIYVCGGLIILLVRNSALCVFIGLASLPVTSLIRHEPLPLTLGLTALYLIMVIRRLTPPRAERSKFISTRELLVNRLLFDRDIRDGKAWINHNSRKIKQSSKLEDNK